MDRCSQPRLLYCHSERPAEILGDASITRPDVTLGRPAPDNPAPDLKLTFQSISRGHHARIVREGAGYVLECLSDRGLQLYERTLRAGDRAPLQVFDYFSLPAQRMEGEPHYRFLFLRAPGMISINLMVEPIFPSRIRQHVTVYEDAIKLTPLEDLLFRTLYQHKTRRCSYTDLIGVLWDEKDKVNTRRDESLRQLLQSLRRKIRSRSADAAAQEVLADRRKIDEADEDAKTHSFIDVKWGEYAHLRLEDVTRALGAHALDNATPRDVL